MKFLKYLNIVILLANFSFIGAYVYSPEQTLPVGVFQELAKAGIKTNAKTEKEIFALSDKFMKFGGDSARAVMNLIKTAGIKKGVKDYNYGDFKYDIMEDILAERAKKIVPLSRRDTSREQFGKYKDEILNQAAKAEAFIWAKIRTEKDPNFKENLQKVLSRNFEAKDMDPKLFETLLKFGADPNKFIAKDGTNLDFITSGRILNPVSDDKLGHFPNLEILELLLKYGADPNIKAERFQQMGDGSYSVGTFYPNYPLHRVLISVPNFSYQNTRIIDWGNRLAFIKLLLKYGANPNLKDPSGRTPRDIAQGFLKELAVITSGNKSEDEKKEKNLKDIIAIL